MNRDLVCIGTDLGVSNRPLTRYLQKPYLDGDALSVNQPTQTTPESVMSATDRETSMVIDSERSTDMTTNVPRQSSIRIVQV